MKLAVQNDASMVVLMLWYGVRNCVRMGFVAVPTREGYFAERKSG